MAVLNNVLKEGVNVERVILLAMNFVIVKVVVNDKIIKKFESNIYSYISFISETWNKLLSCMWKFYICFEYLSVLSF